MFAYRGHCGTPRIRAAQLPIGTRASNEDLWDVTKTSDNPLSSPSAQPWQTVPARVVDLDTKLQVLGAEST
jgi:hypothetical protein